MNNDWILEKTRNFAGARIKIFTQQQDQPWCEAFTANWIRRRCKVEEDGAIKSLFDDSKSHMFRKEPNQNKEEVWAVKTAEDKKSKFEAMHEEFRLTGDGTYISKGGWKGRENMAMDKRPATLDIAGKIKERDIELDGEGFFTLLQEIRKIGALASIGVGRGLDWSHAIGVDLRPGHIAYFDSQLGEIEFQSKFDIEDWWMDCFELRDSHLEPKSAFSVFPAFATAWATAWKKVE